MIYPPKKTARLLPHCQRPRNITGACAPSGITPFPCVICDFIGSLHHPFGSRPERRRANTNIARWVSLVDKNKKMHELQGFTKRLRFPVQNHSADGRESDRRRACVTRSSDACQTFAMWPQVRLCAVSRLSTSLTRGDTKWKMTRGFTVLQVLSVQSVCLGQTLTELRQSAKK